MEKKKEILKGDLTNEEVGDKLRKMTHPLSSSMYYNYSFTLGVLACVNRKP